MVTFALATLTCSHDDPPHQANTKNPSIHSFVLHSHYHSCNRDNLVSTSNKLADGIDYIEASDANDAKYGVRMGVGPV